MSIKVEELRVGNWLYRKSINQNVRISIDSFNDLIDYEPIELTEEILLKCGFEYDGAFYFKDGIFLEYEDNSLRLDCMSDSVNIKYLHQLQNLYFALTNKELNVKL